MQGDRNKTAVTNKNDAVIPNADKLGLFWGI